VCWSSQILNSSSVRKPRRSSSPTKHKVAGEKAVEKTLKRARRVVESSFPLLLHVLQESRIVGYDMLKRFIVSVVEKSPSEDSRPIATASAWYTPFAEKSCDHATARISSSKFEKIPFAWPWLHFLEVSHSSGRGFPAVFGAVLIVPPVSSSSSSAARVWGYGRGAVGGRAWRWRPRCCQAVFPSPRSRASRTQSRGSRRCFPNRLRSLLADQSARSMLSTDERRLEIAWHSVNDDCSKTVSKPHLIVLSGLTSSEKQIPRNCWKHWKGKAKEGI